LFGGPSNERGISINSARSLCDHLDNEWIEPRLIYISPDGIAYRASRRILYQNTPEDFDFRLATEYAADRIDDLAGELHAIDLVFPAGHGRYFEDGELQSFL